MAYYERDKIKTAVIVLVVLLLLIIGAGVFFYFNGERLAEEKAAVESIDYAQMQVSASGESKQQLAGYSLYDTSSESVGPDVYVTPLGFTIESHSENWQGEKLKEIYEELLLNKHGEEINYIEKIVVYGGVSEIGTKDSVVAGTHSTTNEHYNVFFELPALVPQDLKYGLSTQKSVIELYNMDEYETIEQAARTIAHEYGHHYTMFYFMQNEESTRQSDYFALRSFDAFTHKLFYDDMQEYMINHMWSIYEIAAEDYVQIMGSPNTRQTKEYMDVFDVLASGSKSYKVYADSSLVNVFPQENMLLPLASQVSGLRDYYFSFIEEENELETITSVDFNLKISKHSYEGNVYYEITWDKPYSGSDTLYTLVCYDADKQIYSPIRTVYGDEKPIARVGTATRISGNIIYSLPDGVPDSDRYFKLIVILADGRIIASEYYFVDF